MFGATYNPKEVMVPVVEFPPMTPFTRQVTLTFGVQAKLAVNCTVFPGRTDAAAGATERPPSWLGEELHGSELNDSAGANDPAAA